LSSASRFLLLTTVVILGRGKDWFAEEVTFYTSFKESYNLQVNAAVKLFKADIGKVKADLAGRGQCQCPAGHPVQIRIPHPTGCGGCGGQPHTHRLGIYLYRPRRSNSPKIPVGGMIPSIEKKSIPDILKEFEVEKTAMLAVRTIQEISELVTLMKDPQGPLLTTLANIEKTTTHLEQITGSIGKGQGSLGSLVASRELVDGVLSNLEKVNGLLDDMRATAAKGPVLMDQVSDNLATIQTAGDGVVENVQILKEILEEARVSLETTRPYWKT
jgi:phospholipid/cholesterol/gamma-HCH transport system substrate-binding protein